MADEMRAKAAAQSSCMLRALYRLVLTLVGFLLAIFTERQVSVHVIQQLAADKPSHQMSIDWLHIPKTGTSFAYALLIYRCEHLVEHLSHEPKFNSFLEDLLYGHPGRMNTHECLKHFGADHTPLRMSIHYGHKYHSSRDVVTQLRSPFKRMASGFVHRMHDCRSSARGFKGDGSSDHGRAERACAVLTNNKSSPAEHQKAVDLVVKYGLCARGCMTRMLTGGHCGQHYNEKDSAKSRARRVELAKAKLSRFAFVGITDNWNQSMCLFAKMLPRISGKAYPDFVNMNTRPTTGETCEHIVEKIWDEHEIRDHQDNEVLNHALDLFNKRLKRFPECQGQK